MSAFEKTKAKQLITDPKELRDSVLGAISKMATIVGSTLGPGGRPVLIERDGLSPLISKDGVTVAKSLSVDRAEINVIMEAAKEICLNTAKEAGDGTTTAIVLANAIVKYGIAFMQSNPKYNPQRMINELNELYNTIIVDYLKKNAIKVDSNEQLKSVAKISANGDSLIADAVVKAVLAAGDDGTVLLEEGQGNVMRVETVDGYIVTSGLKDLGRIGPVFMNDRGGQQTKADSGIVFLYDGSMNDLKITSHMQDALEDSESYGKPILVFAHDFSDIVLDAFAKNFKGGITVVPIKTPMSGLPNSRSMFLQDMSAYTGAYVYDPGNIEKADDDGFGEFDSARVNLYETFIMASPDAEAVENRIKELKAVGEAAFSDFDRMFIKAAIGKLTGGVSTIHIGGASELEIREKKARVEDAVEAVRSAIAEGLIPGGCSVHLMLAHIIANHSEHKASWDIMVSALEEPFKLLLSNCGEQAEEVIPVLLNGGLTTELGLPRIVFDANEHKIVDPMTNGIIEPAKVCRVSIGNALSVASLLITLGGIVVTPRDSNLENQLELSKAAFKDMMAGATGEE